MVVVNLVKNFNFLNKNLFLKKPFIFTYSLLSHCCILTPIWHIPMFNINDLDMYIWLLTSTEPAEADGLCIIYGAIFDSSRCDFLIKKCICVKMISGNYLVCKIIIVIRFLRHYVWVQNSGT